MSAASTTRERSWCEAPVSAVRAAIARALLEESPASLTLGEVELAPHQRDAVARLRTIMARSGGALLADAVGLGKTYVALALAREAERPLIVAPAALREMWTGAMARAAVDAPLVTVQRLSGGSLAVPAPDLVIVDEAHHFRNPATLRYARLAELTRRARVLLLTATPIHNADRDLATLLALFLGSAATDLPPAELARCIVRRERAADSAWQVPAPVVSPPRWIALPAEDDLLHALASLPPPIPPSDGDDAGALLLFSLLRQWGSSHGALAAALRRRLARCTALVQSLEEGRYPTHAELTAWRFAEDAVQLAFPALVAATLAPEVATLLARVREHEAAVRAVLGRLDESGPVAAADAARAERLRELRDAHPGEKIVAFSQFADTIDALFRALRATPGVAALAGRGARVAGGTLSRGEVLRRFAPRAHDAPPPPRADAVDLLLTTDLLSEGVNLQDASVVVHLDLPWTPARLEQRVGRVARPGAARDRVAVYAFAPPATAERVLAVERRLRAKLSVAARALGASGVILPTLVADGIAHATERATCASADDPAHGLARRVEEIRRTLERWLRAPTREARIATTSGGGFSTDRPEPVAGREGATDTPNAPLLVARVRGTHIGALVLIAHRHRARLVALLDGTVTEDPGVLLEAMAIADGSPPRSENAARVDEHLVARALGPVETWLLLQDGSADAELRVVHAERARRQILRRAAGAVSRAPAHARARLASLAMRARDAATLPLGAGAERVLRDLAAADLSDEAWLRALAEFAALQRHPPASAREESHAVIQAMILFGS